MISASWAKTPLTMALIKETIDAYRAKNNNLTPTESLGEIEDGPLAGKMSWINLFNTIRIGEKGLDQDKEYLEWAKDPTLKTKALGVRRLFEHFGYIVPMTDKLNDLIKVEVERTGLKGFSLHDRVSNRPAGMTRYIFAQIVSGELIYPEKDHLTAVFRTFSKQPTREADPLSNHDRDRIRKQYQRTLVGAATLINISRKSDKESFRGLKAHTLQTILTTDSNVHISPAHIQEILDAYKELPERIRISPNDAQTLLLERELKNPGRRSIFKAMQNVPKGLTATMTDNIIIGRTRITRPEYLKAILDTYDQLPIIYPQAVSPDDSMLMLNEKERTGISGTTLFKRMTSPPDGLTPRIATKIINGDNKEWDSLFVKEIVKAYAEQPTKYLKLTLGM